MTLGLFEAFGVELEYMVVDRTTLRVAPLVDRLLKKVSGSYQQEVSRGAIAWSNELSLHVVELKTNGPAPSLDGLSEKFHASVTEIDRLLADMGARLMPTAMHPTMDPSRDTLLWPHGDREIYNSFDAIFGCTGHGWSNLQSTHLNLPFADDGEFHRLHAALRLVMPLLPPLWGSSPVVEGKPTEFNDNRLEFYRQNQRSVPSLSGQVIPEPIYDRAGYEELLGSLYRDIAPHDPGGLLQFEWLNSRGAIARFDRMAIELRTLDIQECPRADLALASGLVALLRRIADSSKARLAEICAVPTEALSALWRESLKARPRLDFSRVDYSRLLGMDLPTGEPLTFWRCLSKVLEPEIPISLRDTWAAILDRGSLAHTIRQRLKSATVDEVYRELCECLIGNRIL